MGCRILSEMSPETFGPLLKVLGIWSLWTFWTGPSKCPSMERDTLPALTCPRGECSSQVLPEKPPVLPAGSDSWLLEPPDRFWWHSFSLLRTVGIYEFSVLKEDRKISASGRCLIHRRVSCGATPGLSHVCAPPRAADLKPLKGMQGTGPVT